MIIGRYDFKSTLLGDSVLPAFKGSTFRGAFGASLKKVVCAVRVRECAECLLAVRCLYAVAFEVNRHRESGQFRTVGPPHPYVIEPPLTMETSMKAGEGFDFSLLLFGNINDSLPYFVYAFELLGEGGIGRRISGKRPGFRLERVFHGKDCIYDCSTRKLETPNKLPCLAIPVLQDPGTTGSVTVRFLTPLRLKSGNSLTSKLPFHLLVRAILRRISSLFAAYGGGDPPLDYRELAAAAQDVEIVKSSLRWHDWERWSGRQEQTMLMGGLIGEITYHGKVSRFMPLFELCRELHLGKQTTFGLGLFEFEYQD